MLRAFRARAPSTSSTRTARPTPGSPRSRAAGCDRGAPPALVRTRHISVAGSATTPRRAGCTARATRAHRHHRRGAARAAGPRQRRRSRARRLGADRHRPARFAPARSARAARDARSGCRSRRRWSASSRRCAAGRATAILIDALARLRDARRAPRDRRRRAAARGARGAGRRARRCASASRSPASSDDVAPWLHALDVFALPSYANEGVPQALLQAMFAGVAVRHHRCRRDRRDRARRRHRARRRRARIPTRSPRRSTRCSTTRRCAASLAGNARALVAARATAVDAMLDRMERRVQARVRTGTPHDDEPRLAMMIDATTTRTRHCAPRATAARRFRGARGRGARSPTGRGTPPARPRRILIAHHLLLGDTLMLTPLLAKLRARYPAAEIVMTVPRARARRSTRARPMACARMRLGSRATSQLSRSLASRRFDLAFVPGDNRYAWLAAAMRARWIVAFARRPAAAPRTGPSTSSCRYPATPAAWGDIAPTWSTAPPPRPIARPTGMRLPPTPFPQPARAVRGAARRREHRRSSSGRRNAGAAVAQWLDARGIAPSGRGGRGEEAIVRAVDPAARYRSFAGRSTSRRCGICSPARACSSRPTPASRISAAIVGTPTVALFGPGSATLCGAGDFWRDSRYARRHRRSVPLPRPADPVPPRHRVGAPLRALDRRMRARRAAWTRLPPTASSPRSTR